MSKKSYEIGSGDVFKDLDIPNAQEHLVKAQLVFKIDTIMKDRGLKQATAADLLGVKQPTFQSRRVVTSGSFQSNGCCAFWWRLTKRSRS